MLRAAGATLALSGLLLAPAIAHAKTFIAPITDPAGDSTVDARDIISGRIAYNRKSGAMSATVQVAADFADEHDDAFVYAVISDLVGGRCRKPVLTIGGQLSDPSAAMAAREDQGPIYRGRGSLDGTTYKMRVKAKRLSGVTPGCAAIVIVGGGEQDPQIYDTTAEDSGFR